MMLSHSFPECESGRDREGSPIKAYWAAITYKIC